MLTLEHVFKSYGEPVLSDFHYHFPQKGLFLIRGKSGAGKTTLLRLIAGLEKPDLGTITKKDGIKISMVFQEPRLIPTRTLIQNILLVKKEKDERKAREILSSLNLQDAADKYPSELSGGMKLRGSIARSLYYGGDLYLWDEPTKELDPENRAVISDLIAKLAEEHLVLAVTHDPLLKGGVELNIGE